MSKVIEILVILLLFVGPSLLKALTKVKREPSTPQPAPSLGDAMKRLMEELDGKAAPVSAQGPVVAESEQDFSDEAMSAWFEDLEETEQKTEAAKPVLELAEDGDYFTYEAAENAAQAEAVPKPVSHILMEEAETADSMDFDLRKAILYQTILENKYIDGRQIA